MTLTPLRASGTEHAGRGTPPAVRGRAAADPDRHAGRAARHRVRGHARLPRLVACGVMTAIMADNAATALAVPLLRADRLTAGMALGEVGWVATLNAVALAALVTWGGHLADQVGRRGVLAVGAALWGVGAAGVICAPTWPLLLAARLLQGVGAALMVPAGLALMLGELPAGRRGVALAWWSASSGIGIVLVQAAGGTLAQALGWRGLYLPSAVLAIAVLVAMPALPTSRAADRRAPDLAGAVLLAAALADAVLALSRGSAWGWGSARTLGCAAAAVVLAAVVLALSRRHPAGALNLRLWRRPLLVWGGLASALYGAASFIVLAIGPLYLQHLGIAAARAGAWMVPISLALIVCSPLAALAARRLGLNTVLCSGALILGAGCTLLLVDHHLSTWTLATALLLGAGFGTLSAASASVATHNVPADEWGAAADAVTTALMLGGALGVAAATALLEQPLLPGPLPGNASVLAGCLLLAALLPWAR
ncbi:MFS transporter [Nonomuraea sp. NPDC049709]|uniref:MFS transporter n=1 Tax=Nonomuraea sp. NPDC049709 TaxID=3154736 RepID=UPI003427B218